MVGAGGIFAPLISGACAAGSSGLKRVVTSLLLCLFVLACGMGADAETIKLEISQDRALTNSYDLSLARIDHELGLNDIKQQRVDYFPKIQAQANSEYLRALTGQAQNVAVVANTVLPNTTRFQNALSIITTYTLFDYGIRKRNLQGAKMHAEAASIYIEQQRRDLQLKVLDAYAQALASFRTMKNRERALLLHHDLLAIKKRLYNSGTLSKLDCEQESLEVERAFDDIQEAKQFLAQDLKDLSSLTHESYDPETVELAALEEEQFTVAPLIVENLPEYRAYQLEISKKQKELEVLRRQRYPQVGFYSYYLLYGQNTNDPLRAISDFRNRTISFGLSVTMPIFDGFKNMADRDKKKLEIARLTAEMNQKIWDLKCERDKAASDLVQYAVQTSTKAMVIGQGKVKSDMLERVVEKKVADRSQLLQQQIDLLPHDLELEKAEIQRIAAMKKLRILEAS